MDAESNISPTIMPVYARLLHQAVTTTGGDVAALYNGTGLSDSALLSGEPITAARFNRLLHNGQKALGHERVGLEIGRRAKLATFGQLIPAIASAPTVREALYIVETYSRLLTSYARVEISARRNALVVRMWFEIDLEPHTQRYHAESGLCLLQDAIETLIGEPLTTAEYRFAFPTPPYADRYGEVLHSPVRFDQPAHGLVFPAVLADRPSPFSDPQAWLNTREQLAKLAGSQSEQQQPAFTELVRSYLNAQEPPLPDLNATANDLNISARTLNRRLHAEGASFRTLRSSVLQGWAERTLRDSDVTVEAISLMLGFSDPANFRRAFKAWTGDNPASYRASSQRRQSRT